MVVHVINNHHNKISVRDSGFTGECLIGRNAGQPRQESAVIYNLSLLLTKDLRWRERRGEEIERTKTAGDR